MKKADDSFKDFIGDDGLETSSDGNIVDVKYIGKFEIDVDNPKGPMKLHDVVGKTNSLMLLKSGVLTGLMNFLKRIFLSQTKIKDENCKQRVLDTMNNNRDDIKGSVSVTQVYARGAEHLENENQ